MVSAGSKAKAKAIPGRDCYVGVRTPRHGGDYPGKCHVFFVPGETGVPERVDPRNDLWNHSPDGFEWGYAGSGPCQTALGVLAHYLGASGQLQLPDSSTDRRAVALRMAFKNSVVGLLPQEWALSVEAVNEWFECVAQVGTGNHSHLRGLWLGRVQAAGA